MISSQYRSPINYSVDVIEQCKSALTRLYTCRDGLDFELKNAVNKTGGCEEFRAVASERRKSFIDAMEDDLNTADALAAVFDLVRDINTLVIGKGASEELCSEAISVFDELTGILGLVYNRNSSSLDSEIEKLIEQRTAARKAKNFAEADRIRDELKAQGIILEDTPQGVKWRRE